MKKTFSQAEKTFCEGPMSIPAQSQGYREYRESRLLQSHAYRPNSLTGRALVRHVNGKKT